MQFDNALAAHLENLIPPRTLLEELKQIAAEGSPAEVLHALDSDGLLALFLASDRRIEAQRAGFDAAGEGRHVDGIRQHRAASPSSPRFCWLLPQR